MSDPEQTPEHHSAYEEAYSESGFREKLTRYARVAGREVVEKALWLYYAMQEEKAPAWAKATIVGALGYFITPLDAIVDLTPVVGYADDLGVLALGYGIGSCAQPSSKGINPQSRGSSRGPVWSDHSGGDSCWS